MLRYRAFGHTGGARPHVSPARSTPAPNGGGGLLKLHANDVKIYIPNDASCQSAKRLFKCLWYQLQLRVLSQSKSQPNVGYLSTFYC